MNAVILKYDDGSGNTWGNAALPDGVGIQTFRSLVQVVLDVALSGGSIYLARRHAEVYRFFGPVKCMPEIVAEAEHFYRLTLIGLRDAHGFLEPVVAERVKTYLPRSQGVRIKGKFVQRLVFGPQPQALQRVRPPFRVIGIERFEPVGPGVNATLGTHYEVGDAIVVAAGPFANFCGVIEELDVEARRLRAFVSIFGRTTPVELDLDQVKKR